VRLRLLVLFAVLAGGAFSFPNQARAQISAPVVDCNPDGGSAPSESCNINMVSGTLYLVAVNGYQYTSASVSDLCGLNVWRSAGHIGTSAGYQNYLFYTTIVPACNGIFQITATYTGAVTFGSVRMMHTTGGTPDPDALDAETSNTFTTNLSSQSTGNITLAANDLVVSEVVCNSGATLEFTATAGLTFLTGSSVTSWHLGYKTGVSAGSQNVTWNGSTGCSYSGGVYGTISMVAFKTGSPVHGRGPQTSISQNEQRPRRHAAFTAVAWKRS